MALSTLGDHTAQIRRLQAIASPPNAHPCSHGHGLRRAAPLRIDSAALRTSRSEVERTAELLTEAVALLPDETDKSHATIELGITAAAAIVRRSLPEVDVAILRDAYRAMDVCVQYPKPNIFGHW